MKKIMLMLALSILISCNNNKSNNTQTNTTAKITINNNTAQNTNQIINQQTTPARKKKIEFKNIYNIKPYTEAEIDEILYKTIDAELANYGISDNSKK